ncbi:hypothetical protein LCGC14_1848890 [marine sediment metagenome]|uniref:Uncharacterized protein n=1 Tax=marine sediment metagenome TaxID=412755 RepID=A0A0F9GAU6_9ZZZZ
MGLNSKGLTIENLYHLVLLSSLVARHFVRLAGKPMGNPLKPLDFSPILWYSTSMVQKDQQIKVRTNREDKDLLIQVAKRQQRSVAGLVWVLIQRYLKRYR